MKRMLQKINKGGKRDSSVDSSSNATTPPDSVTRNPFEDSPEENIRRAIKEFCNCGGPGNPNQGDEITFLPTIVESAEGSPTAAKEAVACLRKQLDIKNAAKAFRQYNALMLLRILVDNPGAVFTRNIDKSFVSALKELYRNGRDQSVRQLLTETMEYFENGKPEDTGLNPIREWWTKEKKNGNKFVGAQHQQFQDAMLGSDIAGSRQGSYGPGPGHGSRHNSGLPPTVELAARISEAQMSAKLLLQILQSTPQEELLGNPLIREFADRCAAASRSVQKFIEASPGPDESTLVTLFETNEQLASALSKHQLAVYAAKQSMSKKPEVLPQMHSARQTSSPTPQASHMTDDYLYEPPQQTSQLPYPPQIPPPSEHMYDDRNEPGPSNSAFISSSAYQTQPGPSSAFESEEGHYYPSSDPYSQPGRSAQPEHDPYSQTGPSSSKQKDYSLHPQHYPHQDNFSSDPVSPIPKPPPPMVIPQSYMEDTGPSNGYTVSPQSATVPGSMGEHQVPHGFTPYRY